MENQTEELTEGEIRASLKKIGFDEIQQKDYLDNMKSLERKILFGSLGSIIFPTVASSLIQNIPRHNQLEYGLGIAAVACLGLAYTLKTAVHFGRHKKFLSEAQEVPLYRTSENAQGLDDVLKKLPNY